LILCPWCGDGDFDLIGLKIHIDSGWCPEYNHANYRKKEKSEAGKFLTGEKNDDTERDPCPDKKV
jgi:hypothetical protein